MWTRPRYSQTWAMRSPTGTTSEGSRLSTRSSRESRGRQASATETALRMTSAASLGVGVGRPVVPVVS
ncbi:hypothetical protein SGLAM104S_08270 [Streptomyces glaucescens]